MRVVHAAALTAAALLLTSIASAQGIGDTAARERDKRKTGETPKPKKVFTDSDLGTPSTEAPASEAPASDAAGAGTPANGQSADAKAKPKTDAEIEAEAEKEKAKAVDAWKAKLEAARQEEQQYKDLIDKLQLALNDTSSLYTPGRTQQMQTLEQTKGRLAEVQDRISALEDEGRRNGYR
jgi:hypothetical protein